MNISIFLEKAKIFQENIHFSHILSRLSVELPIGNILMQIYENAEEPKERGNDFFFLNRKSQNVSLPYRKKNVYGMTPKIHLFAA